MHVCFMISCHLSFCRTKKASSHRRTLIHILITNLKKRYLEKQSFFNRVAFVPDNLKSLSHRAMQGARMYIMLINLHKNLQYEI